MEPDTRGHGAAENHSHSSVPESDASELRRNDNDEEETVETDPDNRYVRYSEIVGRGRFKQVYKAFDTNMGIDVAWSKISADSNHLSDQQLEQILEEMKKGLLLEHPNIIKSFKCWEDTDQHCINLITELFTSGSLRQYRNMHKHLDLKAVKRMARQILKGLKYLHQMEPPVSHGDLRCDKIYVNGHSGEIKIGDLGLSVLLPRRWEDGAEHGDVPNNIATDVFAFGLCMLELITLKQLDPQHCGGYDKLLQEIPEPESRAFISKCLLPHDQRPTAADLLEDQFLQIKKNSQPAQPPAEDRPRDNESDKALPGTSAGGDVDDNPPITVGKIKGEDYQFEFQGRIMSGTMHFRLIMTTDLDASARLEKRTIDFEFDPDKDTVDSVAGEIAETFQLSAVDHEICAAALREWLAKEMPGTGNNL